MCTTLAQTNSTVSQTGTPLPCVPLLLPGFALLWIRPTPLHRILAHYYTFPAFTLLWLRPTRLHSRLAHHYLVFQGSYRIGTTLAQTKSTASQASISLPFLVLTALTWICTTGSEQRHCIPNLHSIAFFWPALA